MKKTINSLRDFSWPTSALTWFSPWAHFCMTGLPSIRATIWFIPRSFDVLARFFSTLVCRSGSPYCFWCCEVISVCPPRRPITSFCLVTLKSEFSFFWFFSTITPDSWTMLSSSKYSYCYVVLMGILLCLQILHTSHLSQLLLSLFTDWRDLSICRRLVTLCYHVIVDEFLLCWLFICRVFLLGPGDNEGSANLVLTSLDVLKPIFDG